MTDRPVKATCQRRGDRIFGPTPLCRGGLKTLFFGRDPGALIVRQVPPPGASWICRQLRARACAIAM